MDNEEILRIGGECPRPNCIEVAGHSGVCSGDLPYADLRTQLREAQEERDDYLGERQRAIVMYLDELKAKDAAIERGERLHHIACRLGILHLKEMKRAEAAERDADAMGALAEEVVQELQKLVGAFPYASYVADAHKVLRRWRDAEFTPAEKEAPKCDPRDPRDPNP